MNTKFIKHKLPCPKCDSSDAVSLNDNGSAKCFSCNTFFPDYDNADDNVVEMKQPETILFHTHPADSILKIVDFLHAPRGDPD